MADSVVDSDDRLSVLPGGMVTPTAALRLCWRLEAAGHEFQLAQDGDLLVSDLDVIARADVALLKRYKHHIIALLAHFARGGFDRHLYSDTRPAEPVRRSA
jgi:hypothetical protein